MKIIMVNPIPPSMPPPSNSFQVAPSGKRKCSLNDEVQSRPLHNAARRCQQTHDHTGHGGVNARFVTPHPDAKPHQKIDKIVAHANFEKKNKLADSQDAESERREMDMFRIANRDHQNRPDIIRDSQE